MCQNYSYFHKLLLTGNEFQVFLSHFEFQLSSDIVWIFFICQSVELLLGIQQ